MNIVASTAGAALATSTQESPTLSTLAVGAFGGAENRNSIFQSFDGAVSSPPEPKRVCSTSETVLKDMHEDQTIVDDEGPDNESIAQQDRMSPNEQNGVPKPSYPSRATLNHNILETSSQDSELKSLLTAQSATIEKVMGVLETLQKDVNMIKSFMNESTPKFILPPNTLKRKREQDGIEVSDSSRESSQPREAPKARPAKFLKPARPIRSSEEVAAAMQRLRGIEERKNSSQVKANAQDEMADTVPSSIASETNYRRYSNSNELRNNFLSTVRSTGNGKWPPQGSASMRASIGPSANALNRRSPDSVSSNPSNQISRETQEYLEKAVFDDPNDMDFIPDSLSATVPTTGLPSRLGTMDAPSRATVEDTAPISTNNNAINLKSVSGAFRLSTSQQQTQAAQEGLAMQTDPLSSPMRAIESLSQRARHNGRGGRHPGPGRPRKSLVIGDGRGTPEWEREDWDPDAYALKINDPIYKMNSGSPYKGKPPPSKAISRRGVSRGGLAKLTPIQKHAQLKSWATPIKPTEASFRSEGKLRDAEGYILMANGKRDGRSARRKTRPSSSQSQGQYSSQGKQGSEEQQRGYSQESREEDGDTIELASRKAEEGDVAGAQALDQDIPEKPQVDGGNPLNDEDIRIQLAANAADPVVPGMNRVNAGHAKIMSKIFPRGFSGYQVPDL